MSLKFRKLRRQIDLSFGALTNGLHGKNIIIRKFKVKLKLRLRLN